jgi:hypothetical protein
MGIQQHNCLIQGATQAKLIPIIDLSVRPPCRSSAESKLPAVYCLKGKTN